MKQFWTILMVLSPFFSLYAQEVQIQGEMKKWHKVSLTFDGPESSEQNATNPFLDYRLEVTFQHGEHIYHIPGFYAADGNAAETGATHGNKWQVRFAPDQEGVWTYTASFRKGQNIAISDDKNAGEATSFDGVKGQFEIFATDKTGRDLRGKGRLKPVGEHYLQFSETKDFYIKGGANSPEDLLGYHEFDQTPKKHKYENHIKEWKQGDASWQGGKGKGLIGALNYLSSTGINAVYFLTMNVMGDGKNVWPWTAAHERYRFDVSKLDQWESVFEHMDKVGLTQHIITQETENENLLDIGYVQIQRKLYYRELVARFAHHLGIFWNMGEENGVTDWSPIGQTEKMRIEMISYMKALDPYGNMIDIHTLPSQQDHKNTITPLLGLQSLDGISFQIHHPEEAYETTLNWRKKSAEENKKWVVWIDEIGPAHTGVLPDSYPLQQDSVRKNVIWANLMAGGAGIEHYFGYKYANSDLSCEDWHTRDRIWKMTYYATSFFQKYIPFPQMQANNRLINAKDAYCFAKEGDTYVIYLKSGGATTLDLKQHTDKFTVKWYNPRTGGELQNGEIRNISGGGIQYLGLAPTTEDWVILVLNNSLE